MPLFDIMKAINNSLVKGKGGKKSKQVVSDNNITTSKQANNKTDGVVMWLNKTRNLQVLWSNLGCIVTFSISSVSDVMDVCVCVGGGGGGQASV